MWLTEMMASLTTYLEQHQWVAVIAAFMLAASESIIVIGALVPGTALLVALGAAIGLGHLALWPILIATTLGAIAGDGLSFWVGHHWRDGITTAWPLRGRPNLIHTSNAWRQEYPDRSFYAGRASSDTRHGRSVGHGPCSLSGGKYYFSNHMGSCSHPPRCSGWPRAQLGRACKHAFGGACRHHLRSWLRHCVVDSSDADQGRASP
ncbi:DedA family protein [Vreelandella sulfidaeris]|uniref:DedA family protein n=1 Tax=Vreelandella sulfidaeris TaxID=115553 RepID=UPI00142E1AB9|nr:hypothetical protein [Halomonas sulfidaeris]